MKEKIHFFHFENANVIFFSKESTVEINLLAQITVMSSELSFSKEEKPHLCPLFGCIHTLLT